MEQMINLIKNGITKRLHELDPDVDVSYEEIKGTDDEHGFDTPETYYFVDMIPIDNETVDGDYTDVAILVDIAYHEKNESNVAYLIKAARLDEKFRPVFSFGDRNITIPNTKPTVIDHVLHVSFTITFRYVKEKLQTFGLMGELSIAVKESEGER